MNAIIWLASALIGLSLGALAFALLRFKLARIDMSFLEFARRLILGNGYKSLSPAEFDAMRRRTDRLVRIVDLRETKKAESRPLPNAVSRPFDNFLKDVVVEGRYNPEDPIVLACDTGQMSRVAANILAEDEGFTEVYSLSGGVEKWRRWQQRTCRPSRCGILNRLAHCCR